jgi:polyhydroxyalkanoate synthesis repressor PhaR
MAKAGAGEGPVTIKKYANRRLYNTETSSYITLDNLSQMIRDGRDFRVVDAKSNEDITHNILTQIIMEEEGRGKAMLPAGFLRQLISLYGDSMQSMVPQYLEASMDAFQRNQSQFRQMLEGAFTGGPFEELHKRNMAMFEAAAGILTPGVKKEEAEPAPAPAPAKAQTNAQKDDEIAALKAQLASLQAKVDKLG